MLYGNYPHNKTKYVMKLKKKTKQKHSILKQKVCWGCQFPGTTSWNVYAFFPGSLLHILEQLATYFWATDSCRMGKCTCLAAGGYMLLTDFISPTVQMKGTDPSYGAAVQPAFVKESHILPWWHGPAHVSREEIRAYGGQHCSQLVWCKYQANSLPNSRVCPIP